MPDITFGKEFSKELEEESMACRKCLERIPESLFGWKPHEKSMTMGYLSQLVAEIPKWIAVSIKDSAIDLATFQHIKPQTTDDLVNFFNENIESATQALNSISNEDIQKPFSLKMGEKVLFTTPLKDSVGSTINHLVHHRGQLTVYMRLNDIPVPSIYGPSADEKVF